jgi:hypothetical protein
MKHSKVHVQHRDGSKATKTRVVLSFGFGGMTKAVYTDRFGVAIVPHQSSGQAKVIVRGKSRGSFRAPGETVVFI